MDKKYVNTSALGDLFKKEPDVVAVLSKMVSDEKTYRYDELESGTLSKRPKELAKRIEDTKHILSLFPDVELAIQIFITLALNSRDMATTELVYGSTGSVLPPDIMATLLNVIKDECAKNYPMLKKLDDILETCMMGAGSVTYIVIAENILDDIINARGDILGKIKKELYDKNGSIKGGGVLDKTSDLSNGLESYEGAVKSTYIPESFNKKSKTWTSENMLGMEITDNLDFLKIPTAVSASNEERIKEQTTIDIGDFYKPVQGDDGQSDKILDVVPMRGGAREAVGRPLVITPNAEAVLPVYTPGDPTDHIGYYIAYNAMGYTVSSNDVTESDGDDAASALQERFKESTVGEQIRAEAKDKLGKAGKVSDQDAIEFFIKTVERTFINRVKAGYNIPDVLVSNNRSFYQIMLARTLAKRNTKIVFVPYELCTYFAVDYNELGIGINKLEDMCTLASLRSTILFSKVLGEVKNNIRTTNVELSLDPDDPHPAKTIELGQSEALKAKQLDLPVGILAPASLADWLHRAGMSFSYTNHPGIPQVSFTYTDTTNQTPTNQNNETAEELKNAMLNKIGVTQDLIDGGVDVDFATTAEANRQLLMKRAIKVRIKIMAHVTHLVKSICLNDKHIQTRLMDTISGVKSLKKLYAIDTKAKGEALNHEVMHTVIDALMVDVTSTTAESNIRTLADKYMTYKDAVTTAMEAWVNRYILENSDLEIDDPDELIAVLTGHFLRDWQQKNGYMTELSDLVTQNSMGEPVLELSAVMASHVDGLLKTVAGYIKKTTKKEEEETPEDEPADDDESPTDGDEPADDADASDDVADPGEEPPADDADAGADDAEKDKDSKDDDVADKGKESPTDDTKTGGDDKPPAAAKPFDPTGG